MSSPAPKTTIVANGSKFYGDPPDPIEALLDRLHTLTLNPSGAGEIRPCSLLSTRELCIAGNFLEQSAVFRVRTDDPAVAEPLLAAVIQNLDSPRFQTAAAGYPSWPPRGLRPRVVVPPKAATRYGLFISNYALFDYQRNL